MAAAPGSGEGPVSGSRGLAKTEAPGGHSPPVGPRPPPGKGPFGQPREPPESPDPPGAAAVAAMAGEDQETQVAAVVDGLVRQSARLLAAGAEGPEGPALVGPLAALRAWLLWYLARLSRAREAYDVPTYGVVAHIYLSRLPKENYRTAARALGWAPACAVLTAIKVLEDEPLRDLHHAQLGRFAPSDLAREEAVFLQELEWRLEVHPDEFAAHSLALLAHSVERVLLSGQAPALLARGASLVGLLPQKPEAAPRGELDPPAPPQAPATHPVRRGGRRKTKKRRPSAEKAAPAGFRGPKPRSGDPRPQRLGEIHEQGKPPRHHAHGGVAEIVGPRSGLQGEHAQAQTGPEAPFDAGEAGEGPPQKPVDFDEGGRPARRPFEF